MSMHDTARTEYGIYCHTCQKLITRQDQHDKDEKKQNWTDAEKDAIFQRAKPEHIDPFSYRGG